MSSLNLPSCGALARAFLIVALFAGCAHGSQRAVSTTSTTGAVLCPSGYVPAADGRNCVLAPLPPER